MSRIGYLSPLSVGDRGCLLGGWGDFVVARAGKRVQDGFVVDYPCIQIERQFVPLSVS